MFLKAGKKENISVDEQHVLLRGCHLVKGSKHGKILGMSKLPAWKNLADGLSLLVDLVTLRILNYHPK